MSFNLLIEILIILCIAIYVSFYLVGMKRGKVKPVLATWLFLSFATILSFIMDYRETGISGIASNLFNVVDMVAVFGVFVLILFRKDTRRTFNKFEKICLGTVLIIFVGWLLSGQNIAAHLAIQGILVVAYLPMLVHLWKAEVNTESLGTWSFDCLASTFGLIIPVMMHDFLPTVYGIRSVISTLAVIILILRLKYKNKITT
jgi:hypothetical protein